MRFLLDTHALIWWWDDDPKLPARMLHEFERDQTTIFVSAVVGWELATKVRLGKLPKMTDRVSNYEADVVDDGFHHLPVQPRHALRAGMLEGAYRDPFDRMLAAQALIEDLTMVTRDPAFSAFGCKVLWQ